MSKRCTSTLPGAQPGTSIRRTVCERICQPMPVMQYSGRWMLVRSAPMSTTLAEMAGRDSAP